MKKTCLLVWLLFSFFVGELRSQSGQYVARIRVEVWDGNFNDDCSQNHFEIILKTSSGTMIGSPFYQRITGIENVHHTYSKEILFSSTQNLGQIEIKGNRIWKEWWSCSDGTGLKTNSYAGFFSLLYSEITTFTTSNHGIRIPNWNSDISIKVAPKNIVINQLSDPSDGLTAETKA